MATGIVGNAIIPKKRIEGAFPQPTPRPMDENSQGGHVRSPELLQGKLLNAQQNAAQAVARDAHNAASAARRQAESAARQAADNLPNTQRGMGAGANNVGGIVGGSRPTISDRVQTQMAGFGLSPESYGTSPTPAPTPGPTPAPTPLPGLGPEMTPAPTPAPGIVNGAVNSGSPPSAAADSLVTYSNADIAAWLQGDDAWAMNGAVPYGERIAAINNVMQQTGITADQVAAALREMTGNQAIDTAMVGQYLSGQQDFFAAAPADSAVTPPPGSPPVDATLGGQPPVTGGTAGPAQQYSNVDIMAWLQGDNGWALDGNVPYADRIAAINSVKQQAGVTDEQIAAALREATGNQSVDAAMVQRYLSGQEDFFAQPNVPGPTPGPTPAPTPPLGPPGATDEPSPPRDWPNTTTSGAALLSNPTPWNVTADQTVEGRIAGLIDPNNPLNVQLRTQVLQQMNARGMANSALAESAVQDAIIRNAMQIAGMDAQTFAKAAGWNAEQLNQFMVRNADYENAFRTGNLDRGMQWDIANLNADTQRYSTDVNAGTQRYTADLNADTQKYIAGLNSETQRVIATLNNDAQREAATVQRDFQNLLDTNKQASTSWSNAMNIIANIQMSDKMDGSAKSTAIAQVWNDLKNQLTMLQSVSGIGLNLNFAGYAGFDAQGNWVGLGNTGTTGGGSTGGPNGGGGSGGVTGTGGGGTTGNTGADNINLYGPP